MCVENGLGDGAGLEKGKAQQHCIPDARPERGAYIAADADALYQHGVDSNADHNEKRLKAQGKERPQIVLSHLAPFPVHHRCHGDRSHRGHHVDLDHAPIHDDEDADAQYPRDNAHQGGLEPQTEQRADIHLHELRFHITNQGSHIQRGFSDNDAGSLTDHMLGDVKDTHDNVPGVSDDQHGCESFDDPLEEDEGLEVVHVVPVDQKLDQFQAHDKGQDDPGDGHHHIFRQTFDHAENAAVPCLGRFTHGGRHIGNTGIDAVKQPGQIADNASDQQPFEPLGNLVPNEIQGHPSLKTPFRRSGRGRKSGRSFISRRGRSAGERGWCRSERHRRRPSAV